MKRKSLITKKLGLDSIFGPDVFTIFSLQDKVGDDVGDDVDDDVDHDVDHDVDDDVSDW